MAGSVFSSPNESMENGGPLVCRRVVLRPMPAPCRSNAAKHGVLDVVADAFQGVVIRRCAFAGFLVFDACDILEFLVCSILFCCVCFSCV